MATITNLQGSTQIWNSDEIINANFQNINNAIVEKTGAQSIAWQKTFTDVNHIHDVTNNTNNPEMRRLSDRWKAKNQNDAGWVEYVLYVDADNSIVWYRKWAIWGYLKKRLTGENANSSELLAIEFDTYDGDVTYTSRTTIKTDSLYFNSQNITGGWTNRTPTRTGWITSWAFTISSASYKQIWKTCHIQAYITLTPTSSWSSISITAPVLWATGEHTSLATWVNWIESKSYIDDTSIKFNTTFVSWTPISFILSWTYPTA